MVSHGRPFPIQHYAARPRPSAVLEEVDQSEARGLSGRRAERNCSDTVKSRSEALDRIRKNNGKRELKFMYNWTNRCLWTEYVRLQKKQQHCINAGLHRHAGVIA